MAIRVCADSGGITTTTTTTKPAAAAGVSGSMVALMAAFQRRPSCRPGSTTTITKGHRSRERNSKFWSNDTNALQLWHPGLTNVSLKTNPTPLFPLGTNDLLFDTPCINFCPSITPILSQTHLILGAMVYWPMVSCSSHRMIHDPTLALTHPHPWHYDPALTLTHPHPWHYSNYFIGNFLCFLMHHCASWGQLAFCVKLLFLVKFLVIVVIIIIILLHNPNFIEILNTKWNTPSLVPRPSSHAVD